MKNLQKIRFLDCSANQRNDYAISTKVKYLKNKSYTFEAQFLLVLMAYKAGLYLLREKTR